MTASQVRSDRAPHGSGWEAFCAAARAVAAGGEPESNPASPPKEEAHDARHN